MPATTQRTESQRAASRANGARSRGPTTPEGKSRSRLNGLTHGLGAALPLLPGEDPELYEARRQAWHADLRPINASEAYLVDHAVAASMALDRCRRSEAAAIARRLEALDDPEADDDRARADAEAAAADLPEQPAAALARLKSTPAGCRLLIGRWDRLADELDRVGFWPTARRHPALNLLGLRPADQLDDPAAYRLTAAALSAEWAEEATVERLMEELAPARPAGMGDAELALHAELLLEALPDPAEARADLEALVAERRSALLARLARLESRATTDRLLTAEALLVDDTPEGVRRDRYRSQHHRQLRDALRDLAALQRSRPDDELDTDPAEPVARSDPFDTKSGDSDTRSDPFDAGSDTKSDPFGTKSGGFGTKSADPKADPLPPEGNPEALEAWYERHPLPDPDDPDDPDADGSAYDTGRDDPYVGLTTAARPEAIDRDHGTYLSRPCPPRPAAPSEPKPPAPESSPSPRRGGGSGWGGGRTEAVANGARPSDQVPNPAAPSEPETAATHSAPVGCVEPEASPTARPAPSAPCDDPTPSEPEAPAPSEPGPTPVAPTIAAPRAAIWSYIEVLD